MFRLTTRRSLWAPGLVVIGVSIGMTAVLGISAGPAWWPLWVVLLAAAIAGVAWLDRRRHPGDEASSPDPEPERRRPRPGAGKVYDLERDRSTDKQRYLM